MVLLVGFLLPPADAAAPLDNIIVLPASFIRTKEVPRLMVLVSVIKIIIKAVVVVVVVFFLASILLFWIVNVFVYICLS